MEPKNQSDQDDPSELLPGSPDPGGEGKPYPGFGKRHDIFYQYEPPEAGKDEPEPIKPPPPPKYEAELDEEYEEQPRGGHKKLIIFMVLVILFMGGAIAFLLLNNKKGTNQPNSSQKNTQVTVDPDIVSTACYTFSLPKPHVDITKSDTCSGTYTSNSNDIVVSPIAIPFDSLDALINSWKTTNSQATIVSQNSAKFNQYQAEQIYWNPPNTPSEEDMTVIVFTPPDAINPKYTTQGTPIYGFQIDGRYDSQSSSKSVYDSVLSSWIWK